MTQTEADTEARTRDPLAYAAGLRHAALRFALEVATRPGDKATPRTIAEALVFEAEQIEREAKP